MKKWLIVLVCLLMVGCTPKISQEEVIPIDHLKEKIQSALGKFDTVTNLTEQGGIYEIQYTLGSLTERGFADEESLAVSIAETLLADATARIMAAFIKNNVKNVEMIKTKAATESGIITYEGTITKDQLAKFREIMEAQKIKRKQ